ncbi:MAG: succinate dehydrogenase cytochrome b subunit [Saprospiraceae bacterium]|nr:succinate dehydrogenase cytochrome b subunit [Saprospiraceae bacterium]
MNWFSRFLQSSLGQKLLMALTGIFLMLFLIIHLIGNLQLLKNDGGEAFNAYAYFMTHNPLIKTVSYLLYATILFHAWKGVVLWRQNRTARGNQKYAVQHVRPQERASRNMAWLGIIIFVFILLHMYQFWLQMKLGNVPMVTIEGMDHPVKDLYTPVKIAFANPVYVIIYVISMWVVGVHLWHGFWSSFQTLGLNHRKYMPLIKSAGYAYSIVVPLLFAVIPVWMFLNK